MEKFVVIVAGGKGLRMGGEVPKQFGLLKGKPILMRTIEVFTATFPSINVIVVLPADQLKYWEELCVKHGFNVPHRVSQGGKTRFHSVKNGLSMVNKEGWVAVHDAVRPLVSAATILSCFKGAEMHGNAIPVIPVNDSMRQMKSTGNVMVNREEFKIVQTPQVFEVSLLKAAFLQDYREEFTDDASVIEAMGEEVNLVEGNFENIKITRPTDLKMAEFLWD